MSRVKNARTKADERPRASASDNAGNDRPSRQPGPSEAFVRVGRPLELPLELIDEDPQQPRTADNPGFSAQSIAEIGQTIQIRGVKSPISVREHPEREGRYLINHGARRYRASIWAGKTTIPAFIDNDYSHADQVIENLQRNELTAREIADFIGRELSSGKKKSDIAREIGKSPAFVTQHVTLLDLPDPIACAFSIGRASDVTVVNELVTAFKRYPAEVGAWLSDETQELTRGSVRMLREFLAEKRHHDDEHDAGIDDLLGDGSHLQGEGETPRPDRTGARSKAGPDMLKRAIIQVEHRGRRARLILSKRPSTEGWAWLTYEDGGNEVEARLADMKLVALIEG